MSLGVRCSVRPPRPAALVRRAAMLSALIATLGVTGCGALQVPELFRLNKQRQEEGYYMGEFEFKMLGLAYLLDKGRYSDALGALGALHDQLETRKGLVRVPPFEDKRQELEFYLGLQDPGTGAFMDASYPYCVYEGPTGNVLEHLEALARETGQPLRLRHPLRFFDEIDTPVELHAFLDDVSHVGWMASKFPQTSFHMARDLLAYASDDNVLERNALYAFSAEWKRALLEWFHDDQDPETGFWGPRSRRSEKLVKLDLNNTSTIIRSFIDRQGNDIHPDLRLRYRSQAFDTSLQVLDEPMPSTEDALHEWALAQSKGLKTLLVYLWRDASQAQKDRARRLLERYVRTTFERYYVPPEGAFSYYPDAEHATLDGTGSVMSTLRAMGAFSRAEQRRLWQGAEAAGARSALAVARIGEEDIAPLLRCEGASSVRVYDPEPSDESYAAGVAWVVYPRKTPYLDAADLLPKLQTWLDSTSQSMGNWVSREAILERGEVLAGAGPRVITHSFPLGPANALLHRHRRVTVIAFDVLQLPRCRIDFTLTRETGALQAEPPARP